MTDGITSNTSSSAELGRALATLLRTLPRRAFPALWSSLMTAELEFLLTGLEKEIRERRLQGCYDLPACSLAAGSPLSPDPSTSTSGPTSGSSKHSEPMPWTAALEAA